MTFLLDTHAFLWLLGSPERLSSKVKSVIADPSAVLLLSIVTPWEMAIKAAIGKLNAANILNEFDRVARRAGVGVVETTVKQTIRSGVLPFHHRDPFDRLLAAQALDLNVPLLSRDRIFDHYGVTRIWD
jgi:PIN domain nuclease of toxin-antitoxin system